MTNEQRANAFDAQLFALAERAASLADTVPHRHRANWVAVARALYAARIGVREMMSERDRKATS